MLIRDNSDLARLVHERRRELGLTQEDLAGVIGVHRVFVSQFERGKTTVRFDLVLRLVQALGLEIEIRPRSR